MVAEQVMIRRRSSWKAICFLLLICVAPLALSFSVRHPFTEATTVSRLQHSTLVPPVSLVQKQQQLAFSPAAPSNEPDNPRVVRKNILKASLLIAGTTVGGGFLALPQTVVVPLGGFVPSAVSLCIVWAYLYLQSLVLVQCLIQCHEDKHSDSDADGQQPQEAIGIPYVAQHALGVGGLVVATILLIILTEATLVSQLSRAGLLVSDSFGGHYRIGCGIAAVIFALFTFGRRGVPSRDNMDGTAAIHNVNHALAANSNAVLTTIFLVSAVLLFQAGQKTAQWSRCFQSASVLSLGPIAKATPTMLQLLVYCEILPNVCHMLDYDPKSIRTSVLLGSAIPLLLMNGWAALGVALLPAGLSGVHDPVNVLLQGKSQAIRWRLLTLAVSAIGTTILGSYLALESAYNDVVVMISQRTPAARRFFQRPLVTAMAIVAPPLAVSIISPSLFLRAIDFAGSYPVLLLYGVIPPLMMLRMQKGANETSKQQRLWYTVSCILSGAIVGASALSDACTALAFAWSRMKLIR